MYNVSLFEKLVVFWCLYQTQDPVHRQETGVLLQSLAPAKLTASWFLVLWKGFVCVYVWCALMNICHGTLRTHFFLLPCGSQSGIRLCYLLSHLDRPCFTTNVCFRISFFSWRDMYVGQPQTLFLISLYICIPICKSACEQLEHGSQGLSL